MNESGGFVETGAGLVYDRPASQKGGTDFYRITVEVIYVSKAGTRFVVPKGYLTDGASIPPALWFILPPIGEYWRACVLHDYLCNNYRRLMTRADIDALLYEALDAENVTHWKRTAFQLGTSLYRRWKGL